MIRVAILASGTGSNARAIYSDVQEGGPYEVALLMSNRASAPVLVWAETHGIPAFCWTNQEMANDSLLLRFLKDNTIDMVVLAGYLRLLPKEVVEAYAGRILNLHPSLLPLHGGKGMYGKHVHEAVIASGDDQTGITIHLVNEEFDRGPILEQVSIPVEASDDADTLAEKIHALEHKAYPLVVRRLSETLLQQNHHG
jgi:phosphoribosylglycinamide formyltransferase-1